MCNGILLAIYKVTLAKQWCDGDLERWKHGILFTDLQTVVCTQKIGLSPDNCQTFHFLFISSLTVRVFCIYISIHSLVYMRTCSDTSFFLCTVCLVFQWHTIGCLRLLLHRWCVPNCHRKDLMRCFMMFLYIFCSAERWRECETQLFCETGADFYSIKIMNHWRGKTALNSTQPIFALNHSLDVFLASSRSEVSKQVTFGRQEGLTSRLVSFLLACTNTKNATIIWLVVQIFFIFTPIWEDSQFD